MTTLTVVRTTINIGGCEIDAYTANEVSSITGRFINYLSGNGLATSIDLDHSTTVQKRLSKDLQSSLGQGFTTVQSRYLNSSGAYTKLNLWDTVSAAQYYAYHAKHGNQKALAIIIALASTTFDIIIDDKFNRKYEQGQAEARVNARIGSISTFWEVADATKQYNEAHEVSEDRKRWEYPNIQKAINKGLFGKDAGTIAKELGIKPNELKRDHYSEKALNRIATIQHYAAKQIKLRDVRPLDAIKEALAFYEYETIAYK